MKSIFKKPPALVIFPYQSCLGFGGGTDNSPQFLQAGGGNPENLGKAEAAHVINAVPTQAGEAGKRREALVRSKGLRRCCAKNATACKAFTSIIGLQGKEDRQGAYNCTQCPGGKTETWEGAGTGLKSLSDSQAWWKCKPRAAGPGAEATCLGQGSPSEPG